METSSLGHLTGTANLTVWVNAESNRHIASALDALASDENWKVERLSGATGPSTAAVGSAAVMFWLHRSERSSRAFMKDFAGFWACGVRRFVVISPDEIGPTPWATLPAPAGMAFALYCKLLHDPGHKQLSGCVRQAPYIPSWAAARVEQTLAARRVFEAVSAFAHGARGDLSNRFLAPARLLRLLNEVAFAPMEQWRKAWFGTAAGDAIQKGGGMAAVLESLSGSKDQLSMELSAAGEPITTWLEDPSTKSIEADDLGRFMRMLTECRVLAGEVSRAEGGTGTAAPEPIISGDGAVERFRVLIIDDHAENWREVFAKLQERLFRMGCVVDFFFSSDAEAFNDGANESAPIRYDLFDQVILDVLLGNGRDGREVLEDIRRSVAQRPVLLWTTSRDEELTAKASRANGILLKKTMTWPVFEGAVSAWLEEGRTMRRFSLPSPFFNDVIRTPEYRDLVRCTTEWCLKQLDSFHALDGDYFRYFTDHGGRHIIKLFEILEKALAPFVTTDDVLAEDQVQREFEYVSLYLAVVCHELGMFPMKIGTTVEDFSSVGRDYLADVRSLHAPRGMVLLGADSTFGDFWSDSDGQKLGAEFRKIPNPEAATTNLSHALAVLVGYHARCFEELDSEAFLHWNDKKAAERFKKLKSVTPSLQRVDTLFKNTLDSLDKSLSINEEYKERLRRQCALFRFVDAIDIDASRNPASFLVHSSRRSAAQNRESLKRQVCSSVNLRDGDVVVKMRTASPDQTVLKGILGWLPGEGLAEASVEGLSEHPWDPASRATLKGLQKPMDEWLELTWKVIMGDAAAEAFVLHLKALGILDSKTAEVRLAPGARAHLAALTALSVAGEVLLEYKAIEDGGLATRLRLKEVLWLPWGRGTVPPELTILGEDALGQYRAASGLSWRNDGELS